MNDAKFRNKPFIENKSTVLKNKQTKSICSNQQEVFCKYFKYYFPKANIIYSIKSEKEKVMLKIKH